MDNNTLCSSEEEVFRVKVLGFYIYFLMVVNTSIVVWHMISSYPDSEINFKKNKNNVNCDLDIDENIKKRKWFFSNKIE